LLVAIVLLGSTVIATLVALQAATVSSRIDADHARAFEWLQAASDEIFQTDRIPCAVFTGSDPSDPNDWSDNKGSKGTLVGGTVWHEYEDALLLVTPPEGWTVGVGSTNIEITDITFLGRPDPDVTVFEWGPAYCFEGVQPDADGNGSPEDYRQRSLLSQKGSIEATSPSGRVVRTIETVKGG
jgi:hypothetical protein